MADHKVQRARGGWLIRVPIVGLEIALWRVAVAVGIALCGLAIASIAPPAGAGSTSMMALGLVGMTVALWATMALPQPATSLIFIGLVIATGVATPRAALSGFMSTSLWLVFGGLLVGTAAEKTGFGRYVARRFLGGFRGSYSSLVLGLLIGTIGLSFLVPSNMGRLAITVPVAVALAKDSGYATSSEGYVGLIVTVVIGNFAVAQGVLPGNVLNLMIVGAGETLYGLNVSYMRYLLLCGPVLGLAKAVLVWRLILWLYPAPPPVAGNVPAVDVLAPDARRVGWILLSAILLWATDFLHGIKPGVIALVAGAVCVLPRVGVLPLREFVNPRRLLIIVWVATVLSLAAVLTESDASKLVSGALSGVAGIEGRSPAYAYFAIAYLSTILSMLATFGGAVPTMAAAASEISAASGLPLETAVMSIAAGMSALFFPYVAAPIVVGLMMGGVSQTAATRFTVVAALVTCVTIIPLNAAWWWLIGALP